MNATKKPIIRWVVGDCHKLGYQVLYESIIKFKNIYKNNFLYCLCYNVNKINKELKKSLDIVDKTINQKKFKETLTYDPCVLNGPHWKLYPPRAFPDRHEIIIDNDIIIYKKLKEIDEFLFNKNLFITTEAVERSYGSQFGDIVRKNFNINSGLVGLPPFFNYKKEIEDILKKGSGIWKNHFDEQTIVASILQKNNTKIIPFNTISSCCSITGLSVGKKGTHFLGVNNGYDKYWKQFKIKNL